MKKNFIFLLESRSAVTRSSRGAPPERVKVRVRVVGGWWVGGGWWVVGGRWWVVVEP